jgi:DNA-binding GntR family transcriptional regulator
MSDGSGLEKLSSVEQVRNNIEQMIVTDRLKPGDRLPTEAELSVRYEVGRSTIREALKRMEEAGTVHAVRGRGHFLSAIGGLNVEHPLTRYQSIPQMLSDYGYNVSVSVLDVALLPAHIKVAEALGVEIGEEIIRVIRMLSGNGEPLVLSRSALRRDILPGSVKHRDWSGELHDVLASHGHALVSSTTQIRAAEMPVELEIRFSLGGLGPWLLLEETSLSSTGERILYTHSYYRGSRVHFTLLRQN